MKSANTTPTLYKLVVVGSWTRRWSKDLELPVTLVPVDVFDPPKQQIQRVVDGGMGRTTNMEIWQISSDYYRPQSTTPFSVFPRMGRSMPVPF